MRDVTWSRELAYVVGLIATDGCLTRGRTIDLTSKDRGQIETFLRLLGRANTISEVIRTNPPRRVYRVQVGDVTFFRWLEGIGITPRKSLTLGAVAVPDAYAMDLVRGLLDGDGSVMTYLYEVPGGTRPYEMLSTTFCSASRTHLDWLTALIARHVGVSGSISTKQPISQRHHEVHRLKYSKAASGVLLARLYSDSAHMRLDRKWRVWHDYVQRQVPGR